jgi:hypothetical protein
LTIETAPKKDGNSTMFICEGLFLFVGFVSLIIGKFRLYGKKTVVGARARVIGLLLMLPIPVGFALGFIFAASGDTSKETITMVSGIEALTLIAAFIFAVVLTLTAPEPEPQSALPTMYSPIGSTFASDDRVQRLKDLKQMLDLGLISTQEYEAKRSEILSKM